MLIFILKKNEISNFKITIDTFCEVCHGEYLENVWMKKNDNCRSGVLQLLPPSSQMGTNMKNIVDIQKSKILKREKKNLSAGG